MNLVSVVGARPQFVKAAALSRALLDMPGIEEFVVHTGQHFDAGMSDIFFEELGIPKPAACLDINGGSHGEMTGRMLIALDELLLHRRPDCVLVYGDTNSTLAGALSAAKLHIPVAHVEAGLRSFNMRMPEEINRILTDQVSSYLFCPTEQAVANLHAEGFALRDALIEQTGDVMLDATQAFSPLARRPEHVSTRGYCLATIHRAENTDDGARLAEIIDGLNSIHRDMTEVIMPMHPRTRQAIASAGLSIAFTAIEPVGYLEMLWLLEHCAIVATDSGGLQKEAYFFGKPCITVRDQTEWVELVRCGANVLTPASAIAIVKSAQSMSGLHIEPDLALYGEGKCAQAIAGILVQES